MSARNEVGLNKEGVGLMDLCLETMDPADIPVGSEVLVVAEDIGAPSECPPELALKAIESLLTPQKKNAYMTKMREAKEGKDDPVYITWRYLKQKVEQKNDSEPLASSHIGIDSPQRENPLVRAGLIPQDLANILTPIPKPTKHGMYVGKKEQSKPGS